MNTKHISNIKSLIKLTIKLVFSEGTLMVIERIQLSCDFHSVSTYVIQKEKSSTEYYPYPYVKISNIIFVITY